MHVCMFNTKRVNLFLVMSKSSLNVFATYMYTLKSIKCFDYGMLKYTRYWGDWRHHLLFKCSSFNSLGETFGDGNGARTREPSCLRAREGGGSNPPRSRHRGERCVLEGGRGAGGGDGTTWGTAESGCRESGASEVRKRQGIAKMIAWIIDTVALDL